MPETVQNTEFQEDDNGEGQRRLLAMALGTSKSALRTEALQRQIDEMDYDDPARETLVEEINELKTPKYNDRTVMDTEDDNFQLETLPPSK